MAKVLICQKQHSIGQVNVFTFAIQSVLLKKFFKLLFSRSSSFTIQAVLICSLLNSIPVWDIGFFPEKNRLYSKCENIYKHQATIS